jgi:hypothetical protein
MNTQHLQGNLIRLETLWKLAAMVIDHQMEKNAKIYSKKEKKGHFLGFHFTYKGSGTISKMPRKLIQYA